MHGETFVLTGLVSRGGLSNWVFFFRPDELAMVDVGITPALIAGLQAGVWNHQAGVYGPQRARGLAHNEAWLAELTKSAKRVEAVPYDALASIRLHLRAMAHQLVVDIGGSGEPRTFSLMNRREAGPMEYLLAEHLGPKFSVVKTGVYAFFAKRAPFLVK